jgi:hypothetical protein
MGRWAERIEQEQTEGEEGAFSGKVRRRRYGCAEGDWSNLGDAQQRDIRLSREKEIIAIDHHTGGYEEFVVMDHMHIRHKADIPFGHRGKTVFFRRRFETMPIGTAGHV